MICRIVATLGLLVSAEGAGAQSVPQGHMMNHGAGTPAISPSTEEYKAAANRMHADMALKYVGDADVDFVRGMVPHHQGAIDMARVELKFGSDPELRRLATDIVAAQEKEIVFMNAWLAKHP